MKSSCYALLLLSLVVFAQAEISEEKLIKYKMQCLTYSRVSIEAVNEMKMGVFSDEAKLKEFLFCVAKKTGFMNKDGQYEVDRIRSVIEETRGMGGAEIFVSGCLKEPKESGPETSFELAKCLFEKSKGYISLISV
ncbi:PREDICTED: uncharacterized protein LOC108567194 [Nicrophorus vespilloides]|uniref:Uncharacterized protein LOC108567194 n=1 Tax=Nicrophorus vespilloides TaxID=110193 RepID=A0ABM1N863_NICVS|nr:PREDICTED: uncharacterized protein LOC108567194 [Nicrophorus vespilloides]